MHRDGGGLVNFFVLANSKLTGFTAVSYFFTLIREEPKKTARSAVFLWSCQVLVQYFRKYRTVDTRQLIHDPNNLGTVTGFVVVPHVQVDAVAVDDSRLRIHDPCMTGTHKVGRYNFR